MDSLNDCAKRASDIVNIILVAHPYDQIRDSFIAIRLSDGGYDGVIYESRREAVTHQLHEQQCAYLGFRNLANGATPRDMALFLDFNRKAYEAGYRLTDPDHQFGGREIIMTTPQVDYRKGFNRG